MTRRRIGVDIGATAIRAAELSISDHPPTLVRMAQVPTPEGAVANGEVRDPVAVSRALKQLWRTARFRSRQVVLGVGNQRVVVREVSVPWLADKELRASLPFQVQEYVPIPVEEAVLDYNVLEEFEQEGRRMLRLLLVAAQKIMIQQIVRAAELARLQPIGLDLVPFALVRSLGSVTASGLGVDDDGDEAVVDFGSEVTSVCVHSRGIPRFVRILSSGGSDLTQAVAQTVGVSHEEAERLVRGQAVGSDPDQMHEASQAVMTRAAALVDDIRSSLDFYRAQSEGVRVSRVLLTGGGSKLPDLTELLSERVSADVLPGRPFQRVSVGVRASDEEVAAAEPLLAVAIGLAIPGEPS